jgi:hypothetical protein
MPQSYPTAKEHCVVQPLICHCTCRLTISLDRASATDLKRIFSIPEDPFHQIDISLCLTPYGVNLLTASVSGTNLDGENLVCTS